ncbi:roundabout homolog 3 [Pleurodeles waltl]|uniref:roundabout homolog 3 n=1 Tax=Pleurodeles waltl TaxID=8319 RepID=UPI003709638C
MLRYLLKTLLQINLFADSLNGENSNSTDLLYNQNSTFSAFDDSLIDLGNLTNFNGSRPRLEDSSPRIVEHPSDLIVSKGEPATLNCKVEGHPNPIIEWYKDGERVETDKEDPRSHRMLLPSGSLFFLRIVHGRRSKPDEGIYICLARNYLGEAISRNASLEVAILRDDFRQTPSDVVVAAGEPAVMECIPPRGHPEPTISWKKSNIRISDKDERITIRGGKLMMSHTKKSDAGIYSCVATNMAGERDSEPAELIVFERPSFVKGPINQVALEDDTVDFYCEVVGDPLPTAHWRKEEGKLPQGRYEIRNDNTLRLTHVGAEDEGTYTCITENSVGKSEASGSLSVHVLPQLITPPQNQIVAQGRTVIFHCETKGNPPPAVFWQKEGSQILLFPGQPPQPTGRFSISSNGELTITDLQIGDAGYYMCQSINVAGSIFAKALLEVEDASSDHIPPIIRRGPSNQTVPKDSAVQLQCEVTGMPFPSIQWLKDGQRIMGSGTRVAMLDNGTLQITNIQVTDSGSYICVATNSAGETTWRGYLEVKESGDPIQISEPNLLPAPPTKPIVTHVTKNSVTLTWQPNPVSATAAVTSYIIEAFSQSSKNKWQTVADSVKVEKHTVIGLNPNTIYLFIIRGVNVYGLSDPSPISEPVRTQDISSIRQGVDHRKVQHELDEVVVQLHTPVLLNSNTIQVTWTVDRQSQFIQGYRVMYHTKTSAWQILDVKSSSERSTVLTELKKDTEYEIKIQPYFDEFQGRDSELLAVLTTEEVPIGPPQAIRVVMLGLSNSTDIIVSWEPPLSESQNGIIQEYRIWCSGNETYFHVNQTVDSTIHSTIIRDLVPDVLYRIEVAAATFAGFGVKSQPVTVQINHPVKQNPFTVNNGENISFAEQITDVVKQPEFIAASFLYRPAVPFPHRDGQSSITERLGMIAISSSNNHWLADSGSATNLILSGKPKDTAVNCCTENQAATQRCYNDAGCSSYIAQTEKFATTATDGPIYSTIDPTSNDGRQFNGAFCPNTTMCAITPVISYGGRNLQSSEMEDKQWNGQAGPSESLYAQSEQGRTDNGTLHSTNSLYLSVNVILYFASGIPRITMDVMFNQST